MKNETNLMIRIEEDLKREFKVASMLSGQDMTAILKNFIAGFVQECKKVEPELFERLLNIEKLRADLSLEAAKVTGIKLEKKTA